MQETHGSSEISYCYWH